MKKGFTLIELLAVIVILAIIALIATPIVLNIIKDTKESAGIRSAENYIRAVEQAITTKQLDGHLFNPTSCTTLDNGNLLCGEETVEVSFSGSKPTAGSTIRFDKGSVVGISNFKIGDKDVLATLLGLEEALVCEFKEGIAKEIGSKYECEVKEGIKYNFYILSINANGTYNLLMDQNINSDGTPAGTITITKNENNVYNLVEWINREDYIAVGGDGDSFDNFRFGNEYGPITAINFLNKATSTWTNVPNLDETYTDEGDTIIFDYPLIDNLNKIEKLANASQNTMKSKYKSEEIINILNKYNFLVYENLTGDNMTNTYFYNYNTLNPNNKLIAPININYCLAVKKSML